MDTLFFGTPLYLPIIVLTITICITAKERKLAKLLKDTEVFRKMKAYTLGFKLAATIPQLALFTLCVVSLFFYTSHNDGGHMAQILIFIGSIPIAVTSFLAFWCYNYLFLTETNLKSTIILASPFFTLMFMVILGGIFFNDVGIFPLLLLSPFILIITIMQVFLCFLRKKFPDPFSLKLSILSKER